MWRFGCLTVVVLLPQAVRSQDAPEYLANEAPIAADVGEVGSSLDRAGTGVGDRLYWGEFIRLGELIPETGIPFFDAATSQVRPRLYYRYREGTDGSVSEAFAVGGSATVVSGYLYDRVRFGLGGYSSQRLYGPEGRDGTGLLQSGQESYTVLGEAYAEVKFDATLATLGYQRIDLPFINSNDARMVPNTFEAYLLRSTSIEKLGFTAGHVSRIKPRTGSDFNSMAFQAGAPLANDGVSLAGAQYTFSDQLKAGFIDQYGWNTFNTFYLETETESPLTGDLVFKTGVQFADQRSVGDEKTGNFETRFYAAKATLGFRSLIASTAATYTERDARLRNPWGGSPSFNSVMIANFHRAGERSVRAGLSYDYSDIGIKGLGTAMNWVWGDTPDSGQGASPDQWEVNFTVDYRPADTVLEDLWLRIRYARNEMDAEPSSTHVEDIRFIVNYSVAF